MPGSGLGLAIVRQVAEAHGGQVVAERADGGGTRVTLRLNGADPNS
jgi:two-component system sensor histidine kinase MprB